MMCACGLVSFRSKELRLEAVPSLSLLVLLDCRLYEYFVFFVIPLDVNKCCCTFCFQVDLEPQGRLHIRIELKWKSQGIYNLTPFLICKQVSQKLTCQQFYDAGVEKTWTVRLILINCPLLLRGITPGYRWCHTVKGNKCDKCSISKR